MIVLRKNYHEVLKGNKSIKLPSKTPSTEQKRYGAIGYNTLVIPPINTNVGLHHDTKFFAPYTRSADFHKFDNGKLPEKFDWRNHTDELSTPSSQFLCGSCWAITIASSMSDNFVTSKITKTNPEISSSYILSTYPQNKCKGGSPAQLLMDIEKSGKGIASDHCIDYSWCAKNRICNGESTRPFESGSVNLSDLVPQGDSCYIQGKRRMYKHASFDMIYENPSKGVDVDKAVNLVKKHIYLYGPVIGGFLVYSNFIKCDFVHGVYLENAHHENGRLNFRSLRPDEFHGTHAVSIIGWGVANNLPVDNYGNKANVPYWVCRNSWSENWNGTGYFKIAMYPFNKLCQFEKLVNLGSITDSPPMKLGGVITMVVTDKPEVKNKPAISIDSQDFQKIEPKQYYEPFDDSQRPVTDPDSNDDDSDGKKPASDPVSQDGDSADESEDDIVHIIKKYKVGIISLVSVIVLILIMANLIDSAKCPNVCHERVLS